jgi:hypothetical protein
MTDIVTPNYKLILKTPSGSKIAECVSYLDLVYTKEVNAPGLCSFKLDYDYFAIPLLEDKAQVEVWRRNPEAGIAWYCDFYGLYRKKGLTYKNEQLFTATCPGIMTMLSWRHIGYKADTANRSLYTTLPVETIMKSLVTYNLTSAGTVADGRVRLATLTSPGTITVQLDAAGGNTVDSYACAFRNVLTELQKLAGVYGGGDFDLVQTAANTWQFRFYAGQLGTDRTADVTFAVEYGNMANPVYTKDRINEASVVIVGGQGLAALRAVRIVTGPDYAVANDIETFADGRNLATNAGLDELGARVANDKKARVTFDYDVIQTASCRYGRDYFLGDLVTAVWDTISVTQQIIGVTVTAKTDGSEVIDVKTRTQ